MHWFWKLAEKSSTLLFLSLNYEENTNNFVNTDD